MAFTTLAGLALAPADTRPLFRQLYEQLRQAILSGRLTPGTRLPPTRTLANELNVSRNTVVNAFEQLTAEGYLSGRVGSGTYVAHTLSDDALRLRGPAAPVSRLSPRTHALSVRGAVIASTALEPQPDASKPRAFRSGLPALDAFPLDLWARLSARQWRRAPSELLGYGDAAGYRPLREAIAAYLGASRGVQCTPEQVIVVAGSQQAIDLCIRLLLDRDDEVWMEDPGYFGARAVIRSGGARLVPVPVDDDGLNVTVGIEQAPGARMVYVSPSHQFPLGVTLSLARRLALLQWAGRSGAWVIEDDYDSEYRYVGRPLAALQGLDHSGRVIYVGTFSEVLFPSLRLGYMVVPPELTETFVTARALADRHSPLVEQAIVAEFIFEGHFARHIRRMRALYAERRAALVDALDRELNGVLEVRAEPAGMHLVGWLRAGVSDVRTSRRLALNGIEASPLSRYALSALPRGGLVLGYADVDTKHIREGVRRLKQAL